jgi:hypothetical protein
MHTDAGLTRREVLHAGAAVGAAAGMPAPGPKVDICRPPPPHDNPRFRALRPSNPLRNPSLIARDSAVSA